MAGRHVFLYPLHMTQIKAAVFDAYGTLLDVHGAMAAHSGRLGAGWRDVSATWRRKQLEYSWVRTLSGPAAHQDFWRLTRSALDWTAASHGIADAALLADVLNAYRVLPAFPEAAAVLRQIEAMGLPRAILSNGAPDMLADAVRSAGLVDLLDAVLSIEDVGVYKPDPRVYALAVARFGCAPDQIAFVSSNPWDAFGASRFGFKVFWVNRAGDPPEYDADVTELTNLSSLPDLLR